MKKMNEWSLLELQQALQNGQLSSVELTTYYLQRIEKYQTLNAFIRFDAEYALAQAAKADLLLKKGQAAPLTGLPMAHKDLFCTAHFPTTCASKMLANYQSPFKASIVERLEQAGAIVVGKTNMDEFAMGSTNETSFFGPVLNPWDQNRVAGGSSGGSAAAVAADLVPFTTASDTGGSIRQPAAFCGISGIKPTYGLASRYGMVAYASSLDQAGLMARSAEDLALILPSLLGFDPLDSTSLTQTIPNYLNQLNQPLKGVRVGMPHCFFDDSLDPGIKQIIEQASRDLQQAGAILVDIDLSSTLWIPCYYVIACAEASSNLARFDGIRFGHRAAQANDTKDLITRSRTEGFGAEVKRRILTGTYVLSSGYFDEYYGQALKVRRIIQDELLTAFNKVDVILSPSTPSCAFKLGLEEKDPIQMYLADRFTVAANLAGFPAMSIPAGFLKGLPVGMQLMGPHFSEAKLLSISHQYQQMTRWHQHKPKEYS